MRFGKRKLTACGQIFYLNIQPLPEELDICFDSGFGWTAHSIAQIAFGTFTDF
jgi:hypothetical protein